MVGESHDPHQRPLAGFASLHIMCDEASHRARGEIMILSHYAPGNPRNL